MKYQQIVALFLGTTQAVLLNDGKHETEKVFALEPIAEHIKSFADFPSQRTAFYVQTEEAPADKGPEAQKEKYVRKYDTKGYGPVEKLSFFDPKIAKAHTSFYSQFATGMNGDEDLGEDITMKGDKFHFNQRLSQFATGMNGDEDLGQDIIMKGNKFHYAMETPEHTTAVPAKPER